MVFQKCVSEIILTIWLSFSITAILVQNMKRYIIGSTTHNLTDPSCFSNFECLPERLGQIYVRDMGSLCRRRLQSRLFEELLVQIMEKINKFVCYERMRFYNKTRSSANHTHRRWNIGFALYNLLKVRLFVFTVIKPILSLS